MSTARTRALAPKRRNKHGSASRTGPKFPLTPARSEKPEAVESTLAASLGLAAAVPPAAAVPEAGEGAVAFTLVAVYKCVQ